MATWPRPHESMAGSQHGIRQGHRVEYRAPHHGEQVGPSSVDAELASSGFYEWLQRPSAVLRRREKYDWHIGPGPVTRMPATACSRNDANGGKRVNQTRDSEFEGLKRGSFIFIVR